MWSKIFYIISSACLLTAAELIPSINSISIGFRCGIYAIIFIFFYIVQSSIDSFYKNKDKGEIQNLKDQIENLKNQIEKDKIIHSMNTQKHYHDTASNITNTLLNHGDKSETALFKDVYETVETINKQFEDANKKAQYHTNSFGSNKEL